MNKRYNPQLLNTTVQGSGMDTPRIPTVILGNSDGGYMKGDLMDANAIMELLGQSSDDSANRYVTREQVKAIIKETVIGNAPGNLDTLEELARALDNDPTVLQQLITELTQVKNDISGDGSYVEGD